MNKIYFFIFLFIFGHFLPAQQTSLVLTGISRPDSPYPNNGVSGQARSIELYVLEDIPDLSVYGFATSNNTEAGDQSGGAYQFPSGSFSSGDFIYLTRSLASFENLHGFSADYQLNALNFYGGAESIIEILYAPDWDSVEPQTVDFWASNNSDYTITGGWAKRLDCFGPHLGPNPWEENATVFNSATGDLASDYVNFDISEWTYAEENANPIEFGTYQVCVDEEGCTDSQALNYCNNCNIDDGSCLYEGCVDPIYLEYYTQGFEADFDNGSCANLVFLGCSDELACNYNENVNIDCAIPGEEIEGYEFLGLLDGHAYYISNTKETWEYANNISISLGGYLASISSQEEDEFIYNSVNSVIPNNYWIGLSDLNDEGSFTWVNGEDLSYINWNDGEPNGGSNENFVEVFSSNAASPGFWNDAPGNIERYYVLEIEDDQDCCLYIDNICETCESGEIIDNDQDDNGVCDWDEVDCNVIVQPILTNLCDGLWEVYFDFQYDSEIVGLAGVSAIFTSSSGEIISPQIASVETNSLYDIVYNINVPGDYTISFDNNNSNCPLPDLSVEILESVDVTLSYSLESIDCEIGLLTVYVDGPSGIYSICLDDGDDCTDLSVGLENLDFDVWEGNQGSDCLGNIFTSPAASNSTIMLQGIDGLQVGDQIGAFYVHPTCGLISGGDEIYNGDDLAIALWSDDPGTAGVYEGFTDGQEIVWLINSGGVIYNADIEWNPMLVDANTFTSSGLSATSSFNIGDAYEESFDVELSPDSYNLSIYQGECLISDGTDNVIQIIDNDTDNDGVCDELEIIGCTDPNACNYNPSATEEDFSCEYDSCVGCMDEIACDYDASATIPSDCFDYETCYGCLDLEACNYDADFIFENNDSCEYESCVGCTDELACNYDSNANIDNDSCEYESCVGCTDETACNYDEFATVDDATCDYSCYGCTDELACNYDSDATQDNGLCEYLSCSGCIDASACNYDESATIDDATCDYSCYGCTDEIACNYDESATIDDESCYNNDLGCGCDQPAANIGYDCDGNCVNDADSDGVCDEFEIAGCTNPEACNYSLIATDDDSSCNLPDGCTNVVACNYDASAVCDDQSCILPDGCTDEIACNYDPLAQCDNGSCEYQFCAGCIDPSACNYDESASISDNSCEYAEIYYDCDGNCINDIDADSICDEFEIDGCTDEIACNYDLDATDDDDSCEYESCVGCMDQTACDYDPNALIAGDCVDWISCIGCMDELACNYDANFTIEDNASCEYESCVGCIDNGEQSWSPYPGNSACNYEADNTINDNSCEYLSCSGCTDEIACNYDPTAEIDDNSCIYQACTGCMEPAACNYDPNALITDGSCEYESCVGCTDLEACNYSEIATEDDGSCEYAELYYDCDGNCIDDLDGDLICDQFEVFGCTDEIACNYDSDATQDNGLCEYLSCSGCTDEIACNYDGSTIDDGSCEYLSCSGCTDEIACNYDGSTIDDGSCEYLSCFGCTDEIACNYDGSTIDDGSCEYLSCSGCTDEIACNYDETATIEDNGCLFPIGCETCSGETDGTGIVLNNDIDGDGVCDEDEIFGCTDFLYEEYDELATEDDGSCFNLSLTGCMISFACNYNPNATQTDFSCIFAEEPCEECLGPLVLLLDQDGDGVCDEDEVEGCTDNGFQAWSPYLGTPACNYNPEATEDDDSCTYVDAICEFCIDNQVVLLDQDGDGVCDDDEVVGCLDDGQQAWSPYLGDPACNYNPLATEYGPCVYVDDNCEFCVDNLVVFLDEDLDGVCDEDELLGCTDQNACNYDPFATDDDGSCLIDYGCTDSQACNFDINATCNDGCEYINFTFDMVQPCAADSLGSINIDLVELVSSDSLTITWNATDLSGNPQYLGDQSDSETLVDLIPGYYTYTISNGLCETSNTVTVFAAEDLEFTVQEPSDFNGYEIACIGDTIAEMYLEFEGGIPPYDLFVNIDGISQLIETNIQSPYLFSDFVDLWDGPADNLLVSSIAGQYQFFIESSNGGCSVLGDIFEFNPPEQIDAIFDIGSVDCSDPYNVPDGQIIFTPLGGVPPYIVSANAVDGSFDSTFVTSDTSYLNDLLGGFYDFTIQDSNSCFFDTLMELPINNPIDISYTVDPIYCASDTTNAGSIDVVFSGGTTPYSYQLVCVLDNGSVIDSIGVSEDGFVSFENLLPGDYYINVSDEVGCAPSTINGVTALLDPNTDVFYILGTTAGTIVEIEAVDANFTVTQPIECFGDSVYGNLTVTQTGSFISNEFFVSTDNPNILLDTDVLSATNSVDLDFCFLSSSNANATIGVSGVGQFGLGPFATDLQDGDIVGFFQQVSPDISETGYICVGGLTGNETDCAGPGISGFSYPIPYEDFGSANPGDPSSIWVDAGGAFGQIAFSVFFAENAGDPGIQPSPASDEILVFVERDGIVYTTEIELGTVPGLGLATNYEQNGISYLSSLFIGDPLTGGDGSMEITIANPVYGEDYFIIIEDIYGCPDTLEIDLTIPQEPINVNIVDSSDYNGFGISCNGLTDSFFDIVVSGGSGDYIVFLYETLLDNIGFQDLIGVVQSPSCPAFSDDCDNIISESDFNAQFDYIPGTYYITIVDTLGCSSIQNGNTIELNGEQVSYYEFTITEPELLQASSLVTDVSCFLDEDQDGVNDCYPDFCDGSVQITITGGAAPYMIDPDFAVSVGVGPGFVGEVLELTGLSAGSYLAPITDSNGCVIFHDFIISEPEELVISLVSVSDYNGYGVSCSGASDGFIQYEVTGGTPIGGSVYLFSFPDGIDPATPNLSAGVYSVVATDGNGCLTDTLVVEITEPNGMQLVGENIQSTDYITYYNGYGTACANMIPPNGQIGVNIPIEVEGGIGPFVYTWFVEENGSLVEIDPTWFGSESTSLDGVGDGTYVLIISDSADPDGCALELSPFILDPPDPLGFGPGNGGYMNVDYDNDGVVDDWSQDVLFIEESTDLNGYMTGELLVFGNYGVPCNGSNNGFINIDVSGGCALLGCEYFYSWTAESFSGEVIDLNGQELNEDLIDLSAGIYTVVVTDENYDYLDSSLDNTNSNCYFSQTFILNEPADPLEVDVSIYQFTSNYLVSDPDSPQYNSDYSAYVTNPDLVPYESSNIEYGVSCYGASDGLINIDVSGGTGLYTYQLLLDDTLLVDFGAFNLDDFATGDGFNFDGLLAGTYMLYVFDSNYNVYLENYMDVFPSSDYSSCAFEMEIAITQPDEIVINYNLADYDGYNVSCYELSDAFIDVSVTGGIGNGSEYNYTYSWSGQDLDGNSIDLFGQDNYPDLSGIPSGLYELIVYDGSVSSNNFYGCSDTVTIELIAPDPIEVILDDPLFEESCFNISCWIDENNDGFNDISDGQIIVDEIVFPSSGQGFSYYWTFNGIPIDFDNNLPSSLFPSISELPSTGEGPGGISGLSSGYYQLHIEDNLTGCNNIFGPIFISEPQLFSSNIDNVSISDLDGDGGDNDYNGYSVSCLDASDGIIRVEMEGGSGEYFIQFYDSSGSFIELDTTLTNSLGDVNVPCEIDLIEDTDIDGDGIPNDEDDDIDGDGEYDSNGNCISNCNNAIQYDGDGNCIANCEDDDDLPYFAGSMSMIVEFDNLSAGIYSIVINDGSCQEEQVINNIELVAPPDLLEIDPVVITDVSCNGGSDGMLVTSFFGGLPNNWNWGLYYSGTNSLVYIDEEPVVGVNLIEPGEIVIEGLPVDTFDLVVYDINGLVFSDDSFSYLGLAADTTYWYLNDGCHAIVEDIIISEPVALDTLNFNITHPCFDDEENCNSDGLFTCSILGDYPPFNLTLVDLVISDTTVLGQFGNDVSISNLTCSNYILLVEDQNGCESQFNIPIGWGYSEELNIPSPVINSYNPNFSDVLENIDLPDCEFSSDGSILFPTFSSNDVEFTFTHFWGVDLNSDGEYDYTTFDEDLIDLSIGNYSLHIVDDLYGCEVIYEYFLESEYDCPEVPTGFSPNGDGINDYWVIGSMEEYIGAEVQVYNRWGDLVFYSENNTEYWDGKNDKGKNMPTADYFYIIKDIDGVAISHGRVTLRR